VSAGLFNFQSIENTRQQTFDDLGEIMTCLQLQLTTDRRTLV